MKRSPFWTMPALALWLALAGCKKNSATSSDKEVTSLLFDTSSPAVREALATAVDYRITEENYAQWERAQGFLDALPRSAFASAEGTSGDPVDRAVATLESSPRARTAIERTGLSVRDFALEQRSDVGTSDSANVGERAQQSDSVRRDGQAAQPRPVPDTVRDTIP